jgi:hypothetical protein
VERKRKNKQAKKSFNVVIPLVIYPFDVMVSCGQSDEELIKELTKKGVDAEEEKHLWQLASPTAPGRTAMFSRGQTILRLRNFPDTSFDYGCLAHEVFHAVTFIMWKIGMKFKIMKSDEAYAYLVGYLTEQIMEVIGKVHRGEKLSK